jgi:hypothetical protein
MTYTLFDGQDIACDVIYYVDPTNGDDANDGLTPATALKKTIDAKAKSALSNVDKVVVFAFVEGEHSIAIAEYGALCVPATYKTCYFAANPLTTKFAITKTTDYGNESNYYAALYYDNSYGGSAAHNASAIVSYIIGINARFVKQSGADWGNSSNAIISLRAPYSSGLLLTCQNCFFELSPSLIFACYNSSGNSFKFLNCSFKGVTGFSSYAGGLTYADSALSFSGANGANRFGAIFDEDGRLLIDGVINDLAGVYTGTYSWDNFVFLTSCYIRDSGGTFWTIGGGGALQEVPAPAEKSGLNGALSANDLALIRTLSDPVLVGVSQEAIGYQAVFATDNKRLMIPTGDIDVSLAASILRFIFDDVGDVKRLVSVDRGDSWLYWDGEAWSEYDGDPSDKEAIYAAANDTATLNALSQENIALLLPPESLDKHIRFLTLLTQESLADTTLTHSVGVESMRRGYFQSLPSAQFTETLYYGTLEIKYTGADSIGELRMAVRL